MAGQIIARGKRRWMVRWFTGRDGTGKRQYSSEVVHGTKADAQRRLNAKLRARDLGESVVRTRQTLDDHVEEWLKTRRDLAARTRESYEWLLRRYVSPSLGKLRLEQIGLRHVERLTADLQDPEGMKLSPRTVRMTLSILGAALKDAARWGKIGGNPVSLVRAPRQERREMLALSAEEAAKLRRAVRELAEETAERVRVARPERKKSPRGNLRSEAYAWQGAIALLDFMIGTGVRPGEALALRWQDLDLGAAEATIRRALTHARGAWTFKEPKANGTRTLPLPSFVVTALQEHKRHQAAQTLELGGLYDRSLDLVFANEFGGVLDSRNLVQRYFKTAVKKAKLTETLRLYDLRHTHATLLLAQGVHPKVAAERLGHSTTRQTLDVYSHVLPGMQEDAAVRIESALRGR